MLFVAKPQATWVRIPRPKIGKLAYQAQGVGIFAAGEILAGGANEKSPPNGGLLFIALFVFFKNIAQLGKGLIVGLKADDVVAKSGIFVNVLQGH